MKKGITQMCNAFKTFKVNLTAVDQQQQVLYQLHFLRI